MAKTYVQLLDSVKNECRISAGTELDDWIKDVINQEYRNLCENVEYDELLTPTENLVIASDAQSEYTLPVGLRKLVMVEFADDALNPYWRPLAARNARTMSFRNGSPRWYYKAGNKLRIFPELGVITTNGLRISYYRIPVALVADGDLLEVEQIENALIQRVVARVMRYHKDRAVTDAATMAAAQTENRVVQ